MDARRDLSRYTLQQTQAVFGDPRCAQGDEAPSTSCLTLSSPSCAGARTQARPRATRAPPATLHPAPPLREAGRESQDGRVHLNISPEWLPSTPACTCLSFAVAPVAAARSSSGIGEGEGMRSCSGRGVTVTDPAAALGPPRPRASGEQPGLAAPDASRVTQVWAWARSVRWFTACPVTLHPPRADLRLVTRGQGA